MLAINRPRVRDFGSIISKGVDKLIIYKATNLINNKVYIGQTINTLECRKQQHFREAKARNRPTIYFHNAINKYGADNILFEEIDSALSQEELDEKERYWIKFYDSNNKGKGYNLDSGGKSGGVKSEETKRKIGDTTIEKWRNPETARKMRMGLLKGTETMKKNAKTYPFVCPICGETFYYEKNVVEKRKYCSNQCAAISGNWQKGVLSSATKSHEKNIKRKELIKIEIEKWVLNNKELIISCPYNKISTTLVELRDMLLERYNIKDLRTIYLCFNVKNRKELLDRLKEIIYISKENVC